MDLWNTSKPATGLENSAKECKLAKDSPLPYPPENYTCVYEDELFLRHVMGTIQDHNVNDPMFLFWVLHIHGPYKCLVNIDMYDKVPDERRRRYAAMVRWMDQAVENVTSLLKEKDMYENTLIVLTADNGGPIYFGGNGGANNWPLKGEDQ